MEAGYSEEKFKQHIKTVVANAEGDSLTERPLTLDELKELALSMGMSEEEWNALQKKAHVHLKTAEKHLSARNFDDAIHAAEKATSINPYLPNGNSVLAKSYQMLWLEDDNEEARDKAEYYARKELLTDPNDQVAINVLSTINKKRKLGGKESKSRKTFLIIGGAVLLLALLGYFTIGGSSNAELENKLIIAEEEVFAKYDLVQTAIDQRNNMIPELFNSVDNSHNDLNEINAEITDLRTEIKNTTGEERFKLEGQLDKKITAAKKLIRSYGDKDNVDVLMVQIEGAENRIAFEKKAYNEAVKSYNILVKQSKGEFPQYQLQPYYNAE